MIATVRTGEAAIGQKKAGAMPAFLIRGRGGEIRTHGPCLPKTVLYQAELHPDEARHNKRTLWPGQGQIADFF